MPVQLLYNKFQFDNVKLLLNYLMIANRIASHNTIFMKGTERQYKLRFASVSHDADFEVCFTTSLNALIEDQCE